MARNIRPDPRRKSVFISASVLYFPCPSGFAAPSTERIRTNTTRGAKMEPCKYTTYERQNRTPVRQTVLDSDLGTQDSGLRAAHRVRKKSRSGLVSFPPLSSGQFV